MTNFEWKDLMFLNWQHLMYFLVAADTGNFTRASELLFITQSALTKAINNLESELGAPLFEKKGRNIKLTVYGESFYENVSGAAEELNGGVRKIHDMIDLKSGSISVSATYTMCAEYLPNIIRKYRRKYPDTDFSMRYEATSMILKQIAEGTADVGLCGDYDDTEKKYAGIVKHRIQVEEVILIVPPRCRLAGTEYIDDLTTLKDENFIINSSSNTGTNYVFNKMCAEAGFKPKIAFESHDDHTLIGLVSSGLGVAAIPDSPSLLVNKVSVLRFRKNPPMRNQYLVYKKDRYMTPAVKAFIEFIQEQMQKDEEIGLPPTPTPGMMLPQE